MFKAIPNGQSGVIVGRDSEDAFGNSGEQFAKVASLDAGGTVLGVSSLGNRSRPDWTNFESVLLASGAVWTEEPYEKSRDHVHGSFEWWPGNPKFVEFLRQQH